MSILNVLKKKNNAVRKECKSEGHKKIQKENEKPCLPVHLMIHDSQVCVVVVISVPISNQLVTLMVFMKFGVEMD